MGVHKSQNEEIAKKVRDLTSFWIGWLAFANETQICCIEFWCEGVWTISLKMKATNPVEMESNFDGRSAAAYHAAPIAPEDRDTSSRCPKLSPKMAVLAVFGTIALLFPYIAIPVIFALWKRDAAAVS